MTTNSPIDFKVRFAKYNLANVGEARWCSDNQTWCAPPAFFIEKPKRAGDAIVSIVIRESTSGTVLAHGNEGAEVLGYEGNLYFAPGAVNQQVLQVTDRTYTCPYKGTCNWVDYVDAEGRAVRDVAWIYPRVKPGHELIQGRYGFYASSRGATRREDS